MNRKLMVIATCVSVMAAGAIVFASRDKAPSKVKSSVGEPIPEHVVYWQLFHEVVSLNRKADELEKRGEDGSKYRLHYKQSATLSDEQTERLNEIANDCFAQVMEQDHKAHEIIDAARAQFPNGKLEAGQTPPAPPEELMEMQKERNAIILKARDRLGEALGNSEFDRFNVFVKETIAPRISRILPELQRAAGPRTPALLTPQTQRHRRMQ
jgi:hypothetical protein